MGWMGWQRRQQVGIRGGSLHGVQEAQRPSGTISRAFTDLNPMPVYKTHGRPAATATTTGGVHVTDWKTTARDRRNSRRPRRPLEARARTRAAGQRDLYQHGSSPRPARFSHYHGQRTSLGSDHESHGLGRDQIAAAGAGRVAHHRVPRLGTTYSRNKNEDG
jgi:hypothetical protein